MAIFEPGKSIKTQSPSITVDSKLEPGTYRFQLVVQRRDGTESQPVFKDVTILPRGTTVTRTMLGRTTVTTEPTETPNTKKAKRTRKKQGSRRSRKPEP